MNSMGTCQQHLQVVHMYRLDMDDEVGAHTAVLRDANTLQLSATKLVVCLPEP